MTEDDVVDLLTMAAAFDQRTIGEGDIAAWCAVADECGWTLATARKALVEHYSHDPARLMPAHITRRIDAERERARRRYTPVDPPAELGDDPAAERTWLRERARRFLVGELNAWASGNHRADAVTSSSPQTARELTSGTTTPDRPRDA